MEADNTLKIGVQGESSVVDLIFKKLFDDCPGEAFCRYRKVDTKLDGLEVRAQKSKDGSPHSIIIAIDGDLPKSAINIDEAIKKYPTIPKTVLRISNAQTEGLSEALGKLKKHLDEDAANTEFVHIIETNCKDLKSTFDSLINMTLVLSSNTNLMSLDKKQTALFQQYGGSSTSDQKKNIVHLMARRNLGLMITKLADDIEAKDMFTLLSGEDGNKNTPLVTAARLSHEVALASMLNFYSSNISMSQLHDGETAEKKDLIDHLLHATDSKGHNLTYHITQAPTKCLGPYGTILQMEKDFHVKPKRNKKDDDDFLQLESCLRENLGSNAETSQALKLLRSARQPPAKPTCGIWMTICTPLLLQLGLYILSVVMDGLLVRQFYNEWDGHHNGIVPRNDTILFYPSKFNPQEKFTYFLTFMILPCLVYGVDILRNVYCENPCKSETDKEKGKTTNNTKMEGERIICYAFPLSVVMWPIIISLQKFDLQKKCIQTSGDEQKKWREHSAEMNKKAGMVHLSEVCIQATFTSILNWYIVLPTLLTAFHQYLQSESLDNNLILNTVSFTVSIFSLAWSFTSYVAEQKDGALALSSNPISRLVLFISNLLLIFARINCIVLLMYSFGPGTVWPGMLFLLGHIVVMMIIHGSTVLRYMKFQDKDKRQGGWFFVRLFCVSLLNGLANVFMTNFVNVSSNNQKSLGKKKKKTFYRQVIGDIIFLVENIICVAVGCHTDVAPINEKGTMFIVVSILFICHFLGLLLKIGYYKILHIWKDLTPAMVMSERYCCFPRSFKRGGESIHFKKKNKTTM